MTVLGGDVSRVNYTLSDMAGDTAGLIEHLGFESAHVLGHSMGGGIAQYVATRFPERVRSLTLFGTAPFEGVTGQSSPAFLELVMAPTPTEPEAAWAAALEAYRICVTPDPIDEEALAAVLQAQVDRAPNPAMQCIPAILASVAIGTTSAPTHLEALHALEHPTLVIHGTGDLAVGVDGGERLAEVIPGARLVLVEGMGHFPLAPERWETIADEVIAHALKA
jgi:pimeloyl-ACP methyl ester carboxylesterase